MLKIVLEFLFTQMTQTYKQSCNRHNIFMIISVKYTTWRGYNKFKDTIFDALKPFEFSKVRLGSKLFDSITVEGKR